MKTFKIEETVTVTETTYYEIKAKSKKEALENFRQRGECSGSCPTENKDGVTIEET